MLQRFEKYRTPYPMKRVVLRHVPEASAQRLLLENGDADAARNLSPDSLAALTKAGKIKVASWPVSALLYLSLNTKNPNLAKPEVQQAMKWLVDYDGIQRNIVSTTYKVHETFLPEGFSVRRTRGRTSRTSRRRRHCSPRPACRTAST